MEHGAPRAFVTNTSDPSTLEELEARLRSLSAFVGGLLIEVDRRGTYLSVWTGDPSLLFRPVETLLGMTISDVIGPELWATFAPSFERVLETGEPETLEYMLDVAAGRRAFRCEVRRSVRHLHAESCENLTLLIRDVTAETELKAKLVEAERVAGMGLIAASLEHEIRQPLAYATTSLDVLTRELRSRSELSPPRVMEALTHVQNAVRRIAAIAESANAMTDVGSHSDAASVSAIVAAALDICAIELQHRANVTTQLPELPLVHIRESALCQVLTNLLLNASQAIQAGRKTRPQIVVSGVLESGGTRVRISVSDNGSGIPQRLLGRVFDPFFTTKPAGEGTGLGLFVSRRLIEACGGTIGIESRDGEGTCVTLTLRVARPGKAPHTPVKFASAPRRRVLVIDDEPAFLRSLEMLLEATHDVTVFQEARKALALLRSNPERFDAVLCDWSMPDLDGRAFYNELAAMGLGSRFILMTAGAYTPDGHAFVRSAPCRRITKPFTADQLLAVLDASA